jgi:hypothetical protein
MKKGLYVFFFTIAFLSSLWVIFTVKFLNWDFRNNLWGPAYLLWHRASAYNISSLFPDSNAIWFPQVIGLFFPFGLLSQYPASNIWLLLNLGLLIAIVWYLAWRVTGEKPKPSLFFALTLSVFIFPPSIRHLILGQIDIVIMVASIAGTIALEKNRFAVSGLFYGIALTKPQLCILVLPNVVLYMFMIKRSWQFALKLLFFIFSLSLTLTLPLWLSNSDWIRDFIANIGRNPQWLQPSIFLQLQLGLGQTGIILWLFLILGIFACAQKIWSNTKPTQAVLWSMALTTIASPYIWSWDFILLLPLLLDTAMRLSNGISRLTLVCFFIASLLLSVIAFTSPNFSESMLWWFPIGLLFGIIASKFLSRQVVSEIQR